MKTIKYIIAAPFFIPCFIIGAIIGGIGVGLHKGFVSIVDAFMDT